MSEVPADRGFWLAPDWHRHEGCWLAWPFRPESWAGAYEHACLAHAAFARAVSEYEPVTMLVRPGLEKEAQLQLGRGIEIETLALDDSWLRDVGPAILINDDGERAGSVFPFNGWGNRVHGYPQDAEFAAWLLSALGLARYDCPITLEPSALQVDSVGTLIALESAILDDNRNPTHDRQMIEELLAMFLGVRKIIWLDDSALPADMWRQTVDVVRFSGPAAVICLQGYGAEDPLAYALEELTDQLSGARDALGRPLDVKTVSRAAPTAQNGVAGGLDSYLNFYLANGAVFMPAFGTDDDETAQAAVGELFPGRDLIALDVGLLRHRGMGWHSLALPVPAPASDGA